MPLPEETAKVKRGRVAIKAPREAEAKILAASRRVIGLVSVMFFIVPSPIGSVAPGNIPTKLVQQQKHRQEDSGELFGHNDLSAIFRHDSAHAGDGRMPSVATLSLEQVDGCLEDWVARVKESVLTRPCDGVSKVHA